MSVINWNAFKAKFNGKEQIMFEGLAYQLFCSEHKKPIGLMGYKNQSGIEKEPIFVDKGCIGFQAKFYNTTIPNNKKDIIDSIKKAKAKNPNLTKIFIYLNQEFSESPNKGKKDPNYKVEIETAAKNINIDVIWKMPSHFEIQLSLPANKYILEYFFSLEKSKIEFINAIKLKTESLFSCIKNEIQFNNQIIKVDRSKKVNELQEFCNNQKVIVVYGEAGVGKTALIKDFYNKDNSNVYIIKASELKINNINQLFQNYSMLLNDFIEIHKNEKRKIIVIDSLERMSDIDNKEIFQEFISILINNDWSIIFTTRLSYLPALEILITDNLKLSFDKIYIEKLSPQYLVYLSKQYNFKLPQNTKLQDFILNLFYLNLYLKYIQDIEHKTDLKQFSEKVWVRKIQDITLKKNNLNIRREEVFIKIVKKRCEQGHFFITLENCDNEALKALITDEIVGYDENSGYFITHDIYEEWALDKIIDRQFNKTDNHQIFFQNIGSSLPIKKAFRKWLLNKIENEYKDIEQFIKKALFDNTTEDIWKDEMWTALLLSNNSEQFFKQSEQILLSNSQLLLKKIVYYLKTACKEYVLPKGKGWNYIINIIYQNKKKFNSENIEHFVLLLLDWSKIYKHGETTKQAGKIALYFYEELKDKYHRNNGLKNNLIKVIINSANEIKEDLIKIFESLIKRDEIEDKYENKYYALCKTILTKPFESCSIIESLPLYVIKLADKTWYQEDNKDNEYNFNINYHLTDRNEFEYYPASAFQTPIYILLYFAEKETLDFILNFTNKTIQYYKDNNKNKYDPITEIDVVINENQTVKQYISDRLWNMHRNSVSPTPELLKSMHMALEKFLLERNKILTKEKMQDLLMYLIKSTKSSSITSVVVSVVLSSPDKFFDIAKNLFKTIEIIQYDTARIALETYDTYSKFAGLNKKFKIFDNERTEAKKYFDRSLCLKDLFIQYQIFKTNHITSQELYNRKKIIWSIIDKHLEQFSKIDKNSKEYINLSILLAQIDVRKMKQTVKVQEEKALISFNPQLDKDIQSQIDEAINELNKNNKYTLLNIWAEYKFEKNEKSKQYIKYENNHKLVLKETREVVEKLKNNQIEYFYYTVVVLASAVLIRDYTTDLTEEDIKFCKGIIFTFAEKPFGDNHDSCLQMKNAVKAAINTLPFILQIYPEEKERIRKDLLLLLFDRSPIGYSEYICDLSAETIKNNLWKYNANMASSIVIAYLTLYPKYEYLLDHMEINYQFVKSSILNKFCEENKYELEQSYTTNIDNNVQFIDFESVFTVIKTFPNDTDNEMHLLIIKKMLESYGKVLFEDNNEIDYASKLDFFKYYSYFILNRKLDKLDEFIKPIVDNFIISEYVSAFLQEIIISENILNKYHQFWHIWQYMYYKIIDMVITNSHIHYVRKIIHNYLLACDCWNDGITEWHTLKMENKNFFEKIVKNIGCYPSVLDAIVKLLNEVGSIFIDDGLLWINDIIVSRSPNDELEINKIHYLEKFTSKFIYSNKKKIKENYQIKDKVLNILNFLIEKGSTEAYLSRENLI